MNPKPAGTRKKAIASAWNRRRGQGDGGMGCMSFIPGPPLAQRLVGARSRACTPTNRCAHGGAWGGPMLVPPIIRVARQPRAEPLHVQDQGQAAVVRLPRIAVEEPGVLG